MTEALLSIDPGSTSGVVVILLGSRPSLLHHEVWKKRPGWGRPSHVVARLIAVYPITMAAIEDQYLKENPHTLKKLSQTAGAWEEACLAAGLEVQWVNATTWQTRVLGRRLGRKREQIIQNYTMIARQDTRVTLTPDESAAWCMGRFVARELEQARMLKRASGQI